MVGVGLSARVYSNPGKREFKFGEGALKNADVWQAAAMDAGMGTDGGSLFMQLDVHQSDRTERLVQGFPSLAVRLARHWCNVAKPLVDEVDVGASIPAVNVVVEVLVGVGPMIAMGVPWLYTDPLTTEHSSPSANMWR